jgi:hypothetical protein
LFVEYSTNKWVWFEKINFLKIVSSAGKAISCALPQKNPRGFLPRKPSPPDVVYTRALFSKVEPFRGRKIPHVRAIDRCNYYLHLKTGATKFAEILYGKQAPTRYAS